MKLENLTSEMNELTQLIEERKQAMKQGRPQLSMKSDCDDLHQKALDGYIRRGDESELRALGLEGKGLSTSVNSDGGFLIDPVTSETISSQIQNSSSLRSVANIVQVEGGSYDLLVDHGEFETGWADENSDRVESDSNEFAKISIPLHELSAMPKSSQRLLDDAAFDVETWLGERIAVSFAQNEAKAFITGDGIDKPRGILAHNSVENANWSWGSIGKVPTGKDGGFADTDPADALIDLVYSLEARYRSNACFVMNSRTAAIVRKLKDSDGRFLWGDGLSLGEPARLLGYTVLICEDMPEADAGATAIAFGDFHAGYTIAERPDLRILRDPFSAKPHVLFYATKRIGGDVSDFAAIKLLEFSAGG